VRLLALFISIVAVLCAVAAIVNRTVDPRPEFFDGTPIAAAERSGCLVSQDLIGGANYVRFKEDLFRLRRPRVVVLGSSRVLKIASHPGERTFANLGLPETSPPILLDMFRFLARATRQRLTVYLGMEFFWFNPSAPRILFHPGFDPTLFQQIGYLLSRSTLHDSVTLIRRSDEAAFDRYRVDKAGGRCVYDRESPGIAWRPDGSRLYSFELVPGTARPPVNRYTGDLNTLRAGYYGHWHGFAWNRLRDVAAALDLARSRGWNVVGFAPPDSPRYVRLFSTALRGPWRTYFRAVPQLFRSRGFTFLDLRDVRLVPCPLHDFVDDGYHVNGRCAMRIRGRLDAVARLR
jgi:hypothetical protein